ncbi:apolipoprotein L3-like [Stegastes partitus]|uniref:Apolipoprotein L3-like n=1 Tax=Stegastes partitus TaxID=144197 RepID=A0A9Y4TWS2_9TELE|nr:PREDICTED: apolipoprotein L3-like [Stegastes partitus]
MSDCGGTLKHHIYELRCIADNLDKVSKGTKIAGITGGATTVAGGVAAAAGVILSPFTLGASLALTAVGVGVAAAGGVTGASAAIANKVTSFTKCESGV